jgi:hypothetical protein
MRKQSRNRSLSSRRRQYLELLEPRTLLSAAPDLAMTILKVTGPDILVPGDKGNAKIRVKNVGDAYAVGTIYVGVYVSTDTAFHMGEARLGTLGIGGKSVKIAPNKSITLSMPLAVTSDVKPGTYHLVVKEISSLAISDPNSANSSDATAETRNAVWEFGTVGARKNVALTLLDGANAVKFSLPGAGTGQILNPTASFAALDVGITGTTTASNLTITTPAKTFTTINSIQITGSVGRISAASTNLEIGISATGLASAITVHNIQSVVHHINLNTGAGAVPVKAKVNITANVINGCNINTSGIPIGTLAFFQASGLNITAPTVQLISVTDKVKTDVGYSGVLTISQGSASVPTGAMVNISGNTINNCTLDTGDLPIGKFTAYQATGLTLTAPYVQSMNITDKATGDIALSGSVDLEGFYGTNNDLSLGKLTVAGDIGGLIVTLDSGSTAISARSWDGGSLTASGTIASLSVGGDLTADVAGVLITKATINGDYSGTWNALFGSLTVKGDISDSRFDLGSHTGGADWNQFESLTVSGWIRNSTISAANPVGSITAGGLENSNILIGSGTTSFPAILTDFESHHTGTIKSLTVTGIKENGVSVDSIINSNIAAWQIATLKLALVRKANSGVAFGVATTSIKTFTYRRQSGLVTTSTNLIDPTNDSFTDGNFALRII